jgi:hypothetical protein
LQERVSVAAVFTDAAMSPLTRGVARGGFLTAAALLFAHGTSTQAKGAVVVYV